MYLMKLFVAAKGVIYFNGKILLLRESKTYDEGTRAGKWDVPGGRITLGEKVVDGLFREVKEESGLTVTPEIVLDVYDHFATIKGEECHIVGIYFLCSAQKSEVVLSGDHDTFEWLEIKEALKCDLVSNIGEVIEGCKGKI